MGLDAMILVFECWFLSQLFHSPLSLSSRNFLVPLHFLPIRVVWSAHLRLLIFLLAILIQAWVSPRLSFHMMYSAYKLNKQGDDIQPWRTPFTILSQSSSNCCFLTHIQVSQEAGEVVWYSHLFKNFPQFVVIHTVKGFSIVNEAEVDFFFLGFPRMRIPLHGLHISFWSIFFSGYAQEWDCWITW